jgi:hypothetical protein
MEVSGQLHGPTALSPGGIAPRIHWIGDWVDPRGDMNLGVQGKAIFLWQALEAGIYQAAGRQLVIAALNNPLSDGGEVILGVK